MLKAVPVVVCKRVVAIRSIPGSLSHWRWSSGRPLLEVWLWFRLWLLLWLWLWFRLWFRLWLLFWFWLRFGISFRIFVGQFLLGFRFHLRAGVRLEV